MTEKNNHFLGLRTVIYVNDNLTAARDWYADVLGFPPYFDEAFYVGFNVGGFELGIVPSDTVNQQGRGGVLAYWGVEDAQAALDRLLEKGAQTREPINEVGGGINVATVFDPFGNILGIIENPNFKLTK